MDDVRRVLLPRLLVKYRVNLKILLRQFSITTVYVTHDHYEALILADLLAIMDRGSVEQVGTYQELYDRPKNVFVAGFLNRHIGTPPISFIDARYMAQGQSLGNVQVGVRALRRADRFNPRNEYLFWSEIWLERTSRVLLSVYDCDDSGKHPPAGDDGSSRTKHVPSIHLLCS